MQPKKPTIEFPNFLTYLCYFLAAKKLREICRDSPLPLRKTWGDSGRPPSPLKNPHVIYGRPLTRFFLKTLLSRIPIYLDIFN